MDRTEFVERILKRFEGLETARRPWVSTWRDLADYMLPRKGNFGLGGQLSHGPEAGDELIFDSTPLHALELLASALGGLLTNPALPWFEMRVKDREKGDSAEVRRFLQEARERMVSVLNAEDTGFQAHVHELYLDIALMGTAAMYVEADPESVVRFSTRPLGEAYVAESAQGVVDTVFRKYRITLRQAWQEWGEACSEHIRERVRENPEEKVEILHAVFPRTDRDPFGIGVSNFPWACVYLETSSRHLLEESGYMEMPYMVPRWAKAAGDTYGRGPGLTALSDVRVLNAMARTALMAAEKMSDPPLMVPDDGFLGPVRSGPGGLSYYRAGSSDRIEALPVRSDLRAAEQMMAERRDSIRRIFLNEQLQPSEGPGISATEAVIRQSEKMRVLGPVLGRLQTEFLSPLIKRVFNIMHRAGALPRFPEGLQRNDVEVRYTSPVTRAQRQYEAQGLAQVMEYLSPLVGGGDAFGIMDNFDTDRVARHAADLFGVPADYLRQEDEVRQAREGKSHAGSQAQTAQTVDQMARVAKTLSEARMDAPNALTELVRLFGGSLGALQSVMSGGPVPQTESTPSQEESDHA
ncbi:portal protein [Salidesulfovibrio onnuriiensis]|uniref:portal protein n=1 Tax=Salidesulfovibrio onnuriiensis TaxID=2583823 RepID=UPI0011CC4FDE|nr:portal protein [Salidesulfovibrio onnuriiensis]